MATKKRSCTCWKGYRRVRSKRKYSKGSCVRK